MSKEPSSQETPQRPKADVLLKPSNMSEDEFLYGSTPASDSDKSNNSGANRRVSIEGPHAAGDSIEITVPGRGADDTEEGSENRRVVKASGPMDKESSQPSQVWFFI